MRTHKNQTLLIFLISFCFILPSFPAYTTNNLPQQGHQSSIIIYVDGANIHGPWDGTPQHPFQYIQEALNVSNNHDLIYISNGTYHESLLIRTSVMVMGEKTTFIDGDYAPFVITIDAENVTLQNLNIRNSGGGNDHAGILLLSNRTIIDNCTIYQTKTGIALHNTSFHTIHNSTFANNGAGLKLFFSQYITVRACTFLKNAIGIDSSLSSNLLITSSYFHTNGRAGFFHNVKNLTMFRCNISDNSVNHGGVFLDACSIVTIFNSILRHNGIGIHITRSQEVIVHSSTLHFNTHYAIVINEQSSPINITRCNITNGYRFGVYITGKSTCNLLHNNIFSNMLYGVYTKRSDSTLQHNYWGSSFGPSQTFFGAGQQIHHLLSRVKSCPWMTAPIRDAGTDWTEHEPYLNRTIEIEERSLELFGDDTDGDGAPDWWELKWGYNPFIWDDHYHLDPDSDGLNNIEECYTDMYGSNPFKKDIFLEIDWMAPVESTYSYRPNPLLIEKAIEAFEQHNITLHVDTGNLGGGGEIPYHADFSFSDLVDIYWTYFLNNDPTNPRKGIFRYAVLCEKGPDVNFPFIGWDQFDSFLISVNQLSKQFPLLNGDRLAVYGCIHHLGHTLGLLADMHGGIDNVQTLYPFTLHWFKYRNYRSSMNYWYKYRTFFYSDGTHGPGDFDDYANLDFSFFKNTSFR